jgi:hypothetical protein
MDNSPLINPDGMRRKVTAFETKNVAVLKHKNTGKGDVFKPMAVPALCAAVVLSFRD